MAVKIISNTSSNSHTQPISRNSSLYGSYTHGHSSSSIDPDRNDMVHGLDFYQTNESANSLRTLKSNYDKLLALWSKEIVDIKDELAKVKTTSDELKEKEEKFEDSKIKIVETLGLFAALFTLVSVEATLFKNANTLNSLISITFIFSGILILFILLMDLIIRYWRYESEQKGSFIFKIWRSQFLVLVSLSLIMIIAGVFFAKSDFDKQEKSSDDKSSIQENASESALLNKDSTNSAKLGSP